MNIKKIAMLLAALIAINSADAARVNQFGKDTEVCDPVLIYTGGVAKRATWDKTNLKPYVTHTYADGHVDWFYDAFIFNETTWWGKPLCNTIGSTPATQADWLKFIDHIFADNSDLGALDALITEMKATLGEPRMRHKVIIGYCVPCMDHSYRSPDGGDAGFQWTKFNWGTVDGVEMDFSKPEHRLAAVKWYVDECISRFEQKGYKNIDLAGFYSVEESMNPRVSNGDMQAQYNDYVHERGLRAYWIPYWYDNDSYATVWKEKYHFDMAYRQPNYFFYNNDGTLPPFSQLTAAINNSKLYGLGLELEFETAERSNGLNEVSPAMHQRLIDYIDEFERMGVWDNAGVAHYGGSVGYINMDKSTDPVNHATMDRLADLVVKRQSAFAGIEGVTAEQHRQVAYSGQGEIFISAEYPEARVYNIAGREVFSGWGRFACEPGIYIVTSGTGLTTKINCF
ncbi:MAG: DUF4855 domain-containing protein [Muribaculaceae bacterium]|nr:DUF4855 domain-containing protein [Muribaculaceae bacterium]